MLNRSREFIELAIQLNFTKAAESLHLSSSALSRHIADLEDELGVELFERGPLALTKAGESYLESIRAIIEELDAAIERCRRVGQAAERSFSVYILPIQDDLHQIAYDAAALLRQNIPGLTTDVCVDDRFLTTQEAILSNKADVGIVYEGSFEELSDIERVPLGASPVCAWVLKSSPLADHASVTLGELAEYVHPSSTNRQSLTGIESTKKRFMSAGLNFKTRLKNVKERAGFYLTLRPDEFMIDFAQDLKPLQVNPDIVQLSLDPPLISNVYLAYRRDNKTPELMQYINFCLQLMKEKDIASL